MYTIEVIIQYGLDSSPFYIHTPTTFIKHGRIVQSTLRQWGKKIKTQWLSTFLFIYLLLL